MVPAIKSFIERAIAERGAGNDATEAPSEIWTYAAGLISYVRQLDAKELRHIRRHSFHFTGDNYQRYSYGNKADRDHLLGQVEQLFAKLPGFRIDETEIGIGYDTPRGRISSDLQRFLSVLADLADAGVIAPPDGKTIVEIGGGDGSLARMIVAYAPLSSYVLVDLEETLFFAAIHLHNMIGPDRLHLVEGELADADLLPGHFYLVPQCRLKAISAHFDLALNQGSMQEMTTEQVERYGRFLRDRAKLFYSSNLPNHGSNPAHDFVGHFKTVENVGDTLRGMFPVVIWEQQDGLEERAIYACDRNGPPTPRAARTQPPLAGVEQEPASKRGFVRVVRSRLRRIALAAMERF